MAQLTVNIPDKLEKEVRKIPNIGAMVEEFVKLKIFERELGKSKELQKFVFDSLASKSKLNEKSAMELGDKINRGILEELKEKELV